MLSLAGNEVVSIVMALVMLLTDHMALSLFGGIKNTERLVSPVKLKDSTLLCAATLVLCCHCKSCDSAC